MKVGVKASQNGIFIEGNTSMRLWRCGLKGIVPRFYWQFYTIETLLWWM